MEFTAKTAPEVLHRFGHFHDANIFEFTIRTAERPWSARVELAAQDRANESAWCRVEFTFEDVKEWRYEQIRLFTIVIFEMKAVKAKGLMFVGFDDPAGSDPRPDDFRATDAYIAARTVHWDVRPDG